MKVSLYSEPFLLNPQEVLAAIEYRPHKQDAINHALIHAWNQFPSYLLCIRLPVCTIFSRTPLLIPAAAMGQQDGHEDGVCPGEQVTEAASRTHAVREDQVSKIICMARKAPPACDSRRSAIQRS
jgi:hypothetical protein